MSTVSSIGLPDGVRACLFDLDGVLTDTASVHFQAWKETFDPVLEEEGERPFTQEDYNEHVDGRAREDGARALLEARGIKDAEGRAPDVAARKNDRVQEVIERDGVRAYPGSVAYLQSVRAAGIPTAVVSASANCLAVIRAAGIEDLLEHRIDGVIAAEQGLQGKPEPDTFLAAAREIGVLPSAAAVFEDAVSGVQAGAKGGFRWVVGVDRVDHRAALVHGGADVVVEDLRELLR